MVAILEVLWHSMALRTATKNWNIVIALSIPGKFLLSTTESLVRESFSKRHKDLKIRGKLVK